MYFFIEQKFSETHSSTEYDQHIFNSQIILSTVNSTISSKQEALFLNETSEKAYVQVNSSQSFNGESQMTKTETNSNPGSSTTPSTPSTPSTSSTPSTPSTPSTSSTPSTPVTLSTPIDILASQFNLTSLAKQDLTQDCNYRRKYGPFKYFNCHIQFKHVTDEQEILNDPTHPINTFPKGNFSSFPKFIEAYNRWLIQVYQDRTAAKRCLVFRPNDQGLGNKLFGFMSSIMLAMINKRAIFSIKSTKFSNILVDHWDTFYKLFKTEVPLIHVQKHRISP